MKVLILNQDGTTSIIETNDFTEEQLAQYDPTGSLRADKLLKDRFLKATTSEEKINIMAEKLGWK